MASNKEKKPTITFIVMGALSAVVIIILVLVYIVKVPFLLR